MKKILLTVVGVAGLTVLSHNVAANETQNLKRQAVFSALYAEQTVDASLQSVGDLVQSLVDMDDAQRVEALNQYIQSNDIAPSRFSNLLEALRVLGMADSSRDQVILSYAVKRNGEYTFETLMGLLNQLSDGAYASEDASSNIAASLCTLSIENFHIGFENFSSLRKYVNRAGMPAKVLDSKVLIGYMQARATKLESAQFQKMMNWSNSDYHGVQTKAVLLEEFTRQNAADLTKPEFREVIEHYQAKLPKGSGVFEAQDLNEADQDRLFYAEDSYFGSIFFGIGSVIETIQEGVSADNHAKIASLFVKRNDHRLKASHKARLLEAMK